MNVRVWHESCKVLARGQWIVLLAGLACTGIAGAADGLRGLPDPTRPYTAAEVAAPSTTYRSGPVLQSTRVSPTARQAMISGRTYKVGDRIDGAVVADIQPYEVTLRSGTRLTQLRLLPKLVKEPKALPGKQSGKDG